MTTPAIREQINEFALDVDGTVYTVCRHTAKSIGGKWLRGNYPRKVVAAVWDELGNVFVLQTNGKRKQLTPAEWNA